VHLSATSISTAERVRGLEGGADAYLTHPVEPQVLVATLNALLRARRAEARYGRIFATGLLGIVTWDEAGTIVDANDTFLQLVGWDRAEVKAGRLRWDALAGAPPAAGRAAAAGDGDATEEMELVRRDGRRVPVLVGRAAEEDQGEAVAFVLDISERKRAEQALRDADRRKDEFLAILSHELRNPLAPIRNAVHLLARAPAGGEQAARARHILERQTTHLTRIVDDLLDVTRIASGKVELRRARIDLREVVQKTADDVRSIFDEARLPLRVDQPASAVWVDADATRIAQVVANLLQNAGKFTPSGGEVTVAVLAAGDRAEVRVSDTGIGIEPGEVQHMFEPFAQADRSLARAQGGLGLGLALARGLVELHGGAMAARSEGLGRGAEFTMSLPLAEPAAAPRAGDAAETGAGALSVLVVEDNEDAAQSLADVLELRGYRVWVAHDGRSGIARARELRPDVVLCDIGLPDVDGYEVARVLSADDALRGTRLVALSGYAQPEDRARARTAGFAAHLAKPPRLEQLEEAFGAPGGGGTPEDRNASPAPR
jgi:PAS domain S-box-containing protein